MVKSERNVEKVKRVARMAVTTLLVAGATAVVAAIPAHADEPQGTGENASVSGQTHGAFADMNGDFGWLGKNGGTPGYHNAVGQEPGATGYNNSAGSPWKGSGK